MGKLTTHVLDTALGRPAAGLQIALFRVDGTERTQLSTHLTNADGRCDAPLLDGADFVTGKYELEYVSGAYHRAQGVAVTDPPFLEDISISFGIAEESHYHVPLLLSPYGYSTYRGS